MPPSFIHLRTHSAYSLAEGMLPIAKLVAHAAQHGQPAIAITDSFNTYGALEFAEAARNAGVQPIIGAQVMLAEESREGEGNGAYKDHNTREDDGVGEVVLLAQNEMGWRNLSRLMSSALLRAEKHPAISLAELEADNGDLCAGLIVLTGGARRGFIAAPLADDKPHVAEARLQRLLPLFKDRLYIELQRHHLPDEAAAEGGLLDLAYDKGLGLLATNDCYFAKRDEAEAHSILLCISQGTTLDNPERRQETEEHYLKSSEEMQALFSDLPEAIANSVAIAQRCAFAPESRRDSPMLPAFAVPEAYKAQNKNKGEGKGESDGKNEGKNEGKNDSQTEYLHALAKEGLAKRLTIHKPSVSDQDYEGRLNYELKIISQMGFAGYFLIVADFINWARDNNIPVGPGRGSGAGSLVSFALGITDLDPMRWGLLFERFLNPERISMPDFDIDFCQNRRDEVITYVQDKYGKDRVAQIITFGSLHARAALRDVGRVLGMSYGQVDRIAKLIPINPINPIKLEQVVKEEDELKQAIKSDEQVANLVRISGQIEGLLRHSSTHAAGVVIGDRPLIDLVPLTRDYRSDILVTQFNMKSVEDAGLVKFDFLGLKTLTVQQETMRLLAKKGITIDLAQIPLDDEKSFAMLGEGDTAGLFQLESDGMRDVLRRLKPDRFEDIIAVVALYRPGPMENIPDYIARKHNPQKVKSLHPMLDALLAETYGIMIYQEQAQLAAQIVAGYSLGEADILRRAMSKKDKKVMQAQRSQFIKGAAKNNLAQHTAGNIFDQISAFAGYGFNKSHAAAYALIAWQTAWLKCHHTAEFMAALMTFDANNTDKLAFAREDCVNHNIEVLPPSVNDSDAVFTATETKAKDKTTTAIRYGLGAIRNVGKEAMVGVVEERLANGAFASLENFISRAAPHLNRKLLEFLIKSGALDGFGYSRAALMAGLEHLTAFAVSVRIDMESAQDKLFTGGDDMGLSIADAPEWEMQDKLEYEREALGFYLSAHPFDAYAEALQKHNIDLTLAHQIESRVMQNESGRVGLNCAGVIISKRKRLAHNGGHYAFLQISDSSGMFEVVTFSELYSEAEHMLQARTPVILRIEGKLEAGRLRLQATKIRLLDEVLKEKTPTKPRTLHVQVSHTCSAENLEALIGGVKRVAKGNDRLQLEVHALTGGNGTAQIHATDFTDSGERYDFTADFRKFAKTLDGVVVRETYGDSDNEETETLH